MMMPARYWFAPDIPHAWRLYQPGHAPGYQGMTGLGLANPGTVDLIRQYAAYYGVDPDLALSVARHESTPNLNQSAVSPQGAIGVFQLMPKTAAWLGVDPYDLEDNIRGGTMYLSQMLKRYGGDVPAALAAYNEGPGAYDSGKMYAETRAYVDGIMADWGGPSTDTSPADTPPGDPIRASGGPQGTAGDGSGPPSPPPSDPGAFLVAALAGGVILYAFA